MKLQVKVSDKVTIEIEAAKQKDAFKAMASAQEVFGETHCGCCGSGNIVPFWRTASKLVGKKTETYEYPEWKCNDCNSRLSLGTINDDSGTLFPQRKLVNGKQPTKEQRETGQAKYDAKTHGWHKFVHKNEDNDEQNDQGDSDDQGAYKPQGNGRANAQGHPQQGRRPAPTPAPQGDSDIPF